MARIEVPTARLLLRTPRIEDAEIMFARYASVPEVTRFLGWRRHGTVEETRAFVKLSREEWASRDCGPWLIWSRDGARLLGSTGLHFATVERAITGYVLATDAWGQGYATEALRAVIDVARDAGFREIDALCHVDHRASARVLEKCGFAAIAILREQAFPNLSPPHASAFQYRLEVAPP